MELLHWPYISHNYSSSRVTIVLTQRFGSPQGHNNGNQLHFLGNTISRASGSALSLGFRATHQEVRALRVQVIGARVCEPQTTEGHAVCQTANLPFGAGSISRAPFNTVPLSGNSDIMRLRTLNANFGTPNFPQPTGLGSYRAPTISLLDDPQDWGPFSQS